MTEPINGKKHMIVYNARTLEGVTAAAILNSAIKDATLTPIEKGVEFNPSAAKQYGIIHLVDWELEVDTFKEIHQDVIVLIYSENTEYKDLLAKEGISFLDISDAQGEGGPIILAWKHAKDEEIPATVSALSKFILDEHIDNVEAYQYGMRLFPTDPSNGEFWDEVFTGGAEYYQHVAYLGSMFIKKQRNNDARLCRVGAFYTEIDGRPAVAVNQLLATSSFFESVYDPEHHDIMIGFAFSKGFWVISMFTEKDDIDLRPIAEKFNALPSSLRNLKNAAGFNCFQLPFGFPKAKQAGPIEASQVDSAEADGLEVSDE